MPVYISFFVIFIPIWLTFLLISLGRDDLRLKKRIENLYLRETTYKKSLVRLYKFRQYNRGKDEQHEKNDDIFLLFYKKLPVLRIIQSVFILFEFTSISLGIYIITYKQNIFSSSGLFKEEITHVGFDVILFSMTIIILLIISVWIYYFRGGVISLLEDLSKLIPQKSS